MPEKNEPVYEILVFITYASLHCPAQCTEIAPLDSCACMLKECIHEKCHDLVDMRGS